MTKEAKPKKEKVAKEPAVSQNGVSRPAAGTKTARIWDIADSLSAAAGAPVARKMVLDAAAAEAINVTTAATQFGRWTKFHGIKAAPRVKAEKAESAEAGAGEAVVE